VQATDSGAEVDADADDPFVDDDDDDDDENASDKEEHCEESIVKGQEKGEGEGSPAKSVPDMYKAFDGSALMAIGTTPLLKILRQKLNEAMQVCYYKSMYQCF